MNLWGKRFPPNVELPKQKTKTLTKKEAIHYLKACVSEMLHAGMGEDHLVYKGETITIKEIKQKVGW